MRLARVRGRPRQSGDGDDVCGYLFGSAELPPLPVSEGAHEKKSYLNISYKPVSHRNQNKKSKRPITRKLSANRSQIKLCLPRTTFIHLRRLERSAPPPPSVIFSGPRIFDPAGSASRRTNHAVSPYCRPKGDNSNRRLSFRSGQRWLEFWIHITIY
jgi:hypothetical protein